MRFLRACSRCRFRKGQLAKVTERSAENLTKKVKKDIKAVEKRILNVNKRRRAGRAAIDARKTGNGYTSSRSSL
jgi:hypothetical protein